MRRVEYSEYRDRNIEFQGTSNVKWIKDLVVAGEANFLNYGVDFQECEYGVGNYTTAILELDDGQVKTVPIEQIKFIGGGE